MTAPLRITERADYALRSVLLLSGHDGEYLTAKAVAEHFGMSTKMLASVLWNLRAAGILESRPGWHGGFRLACPPENIPVSAVIAAARGEDAAAPATHRSQPRPNSPAPLSTGRTGDLVDGFWRALDDHVQGILDTFSVADLAGARALP